MFLFCFFFKIIIFFFNYRCKHSQRERISFPGATSITIYFDHRCKLDYDDNLLFSMHNRRGADDLGRFQLQKEVCYYDFIYLFLIFI